MRYDTVIIGAGAAGMMCAAHCGGRVLVVDHAKAAGEKIRISGGGRCNFTNLECAPDRFLCTNPHFHKSALARYTQWDFIDLIASHGIAYHEKTLGQLFCDTSAKDIIAMLRAMMHDAGAELRLGTSASAIERTGSGFDLTLSREGKETRITTTRLVIATGGKSIPKMGATGFAYDVARQFDVPVTDTRAGLVPLTFDQGRFAALAGVATPARISANGTSFDEAMLFTHRGLSGPAILQISSYWDQGDSISVNLDPEGTLFDALRAQRQRTGRKNIATVLARHLPARLAEYLVRELAVTGNLADQSDAALSTLCTALRDWQLTPSGSEGYRTAEVTLGGIDTDALSSTTLEVKAVPDLYFIGEAVDVTGWLGGYNFQWAWSSAMACARTMAD